MYLTAACYEIPTCYDQEYLDFWDTHPVGDTLFDLKFPSPTYHFSSQFRSDWLDLHWSIDDTDLDVAEIVQVEPNDGKIVHVLLYRNIILLLIICSITLYHSYKILFQSCLALLLPRYGPTCFPCICLFIFLCVDFCFFFSLSYLVSGVGCGFLSRRSLDFFSRILLVGWQRAKKASISGVTRIPCITKRVIYQNVRQSL